MANIKTKSSRAPPKGAVPAAHAHAVHESFEKPLNGSWVAELEDAKAKLAAALRSSSTTKNTKKDAANDDEDAVLKGYLRLCRAYSMLRQWDRLFDASQKGMMKAASRPAAASAVVMASLQRYRTMAKAEQPPDDDVATREAIRHIVLNGGKIPEGLVFPFGSIKNATPLHEAVTKRDVRMVELLVALGLPIDAPVSLRGQTQEEDDGRFASSGASALVVACAFAALSLEPVDGDHYDRLWESKAQDDAAECAMQLVRLGADPTIMMPENLGPDVSVHWPHKGQTAYQIAAMSKRRPLVALMMEHMQMSPEERAEVVHCRCGSRLPWKQCHAVGLGQPSHYVVNSKSKKAGATSHDVFYRLSPHGRCPCRTTNKTYYECCWTDNRAAVYLHDKTAEFLCRKVDAPILPSLQKCLKNLARRKRDAAGALRALKDGDSSWITSCARLFPNHPTLFAALCKDVGTKSQMSAWDPVVYAGCVERLETPFLWRDVHWELDRSVLCHQVQEWNDALLDYCDDVGLQDADREIVVIRHSASPCGPCGSVGCSSFERYVREFRRCSGCRTISYCSRTCQKDHWGVHQAVCGIGVTVTSAPIRVSHRSSGDKKNDTNDGTS